MWKTGIFILLFTPMCWGYKLTQDFVNGFYWASLPINIAISETDPSRKATLTSLTEDAIGEWQARTGLNLWSFTTGASTNIIRWSTNFSKETGMDSMTVLAVAIRHTSGPYFAKAEIVINGGHPLNSDVGHLLTTITHELGHTMGLDHSENGLAVMAPILQDPYRGLHNDDVKGMNQAYSETENRQITKYVSPLAYEKSSSSSGMSCGTITTSAPQTFQGALSLMAGLLIGFVRKLVGWFKSLF